MNAVEIEEAVSDLALAPFDAAAFPYAFLAAFGNKAAAIARLKSGSTNASDVAGGVLQRNHIHLATCAPGKVGETLAALKASPRMARAKCKFVLATDGEQLEAEELATGEVLACAYGEFANHFGFFLPLAGITTVAEVKNNPIDIKATGRLYKLYEELIKQNPTWDTVQRRHDLNQFMARLIFCFFAEDTGIFPGNGLFTQAITQMSDATNTHDVIGELFRVMDMPSEERDAAKLRERLDKFPYVNGGLFAGTRDVPRFSKIARAYLLRVGELDWKHINPDIFGSMIQGIADEDERGSLGMHYTSVPNILKVLDPLFLDDLREKLDEAGDNARKLLNLRKRIANIRVFDPACGSGNFLVIAYIKMREIEAEIIRRRNDEKKSWIPLTNFYGIEIKDFACETARLSLLIAEFQCDARLIGQREACLNVLPLKKTGQIHCGNALRMDWDEVCPPPTELGDDQSAQQPTNVVGGETYICGNPPYRGSQGQTASQKEDLKIAFDQHLDLASAADYVGGWFMKAKHLTKRFGYRSALVTTNSLHQGRQVSLLWSNLFEDGVEVGFANPSFKWSNLASDKAGVTVSVIGFNRESAAPKLLYGEDQVRSVQRIGPYLLPGNTTVVEARAKPLSDLPPMNYGSMPNDGGHLLLEAAEKNGILEADQGAAEFIREFWGADEAVSGTPRYCIWVENDRADLAATLPSLKERFEKVRARRLDTTRAATRALASVPWRFGEVRQSGHDQALVVPIHTSEMRTVLPIVLLPRGAIVSNACYRITNAPLWIAALAMSRCHLVWIATVCGKIKTDYRYSNTLGWNTFPLPHLTERNKADLTSCAHNVLVAREAHFPASIAQLYDPDSMPEDVRRAHDSNDETLERIYIGRRFKNDTERLEHLFDRYTKMTTEKPTKQGAGQA